MEVIGHEMPRLSERRRLPMEELVLLHEAWSFTRITRHRIVEGASDALYSWCSSIDVPHLFSMRCDVAAGEKEMSPGPVVLEVFVPVLTESESNASDVEHWSKKHKRHRYQKDITAWYLQAALMKLSSAGTPTAMRKSTHPQAPVPFQKVPVAFLDGPLVVNLIRHATRKLDSDNIEGALKSIRDSVAIFLGRDDSEKGNIDWREKEQRIGRVVGVMIRVESIIENAKARKQRVLRLLETNTNRELVLRLVHLLEKIYGADSEKLALLVIEAEEQAKNLR